MAVVASLLEENVVEVHDLTVRYGDTVALAGVSLSAPRGRVLAVVGKNGAGKSTLFRALLGLIPVERGELRLLGLPSRTLSATDRARVAFVSERHAELGHARVDELARLRASLYPAFDAGLFASLTAEAEVRATARVGELSRGQRAIVCVGLALAQRPELLLLDDPTLGLDPLARRRVMQALLSATRSEAVTVLFASHELADVERVADDVLLLARGHGSLAVSLEDFVADACVALLPSACDRAALSEVQGVLWVWPRRHGLEVVVRGDEHERDATLGALARIAATEVETPRPVSFEELALAWLAADRGVS